MGWNRMEWDGMGWNGIGWDNEWIRIAGSTDGQMNKWMEGWFVWMGCMGGK